MGKENKEKETMTAQSDNSFNENEQNDTKTIDLNQTGDEKVEETIETNNEKETIETNDEKETIETNDEKETIETNDEKETAEERDEELDPVTLLNTIAKLEEKTVRLEAEKEAVDNRFQRLQADFANYRKRTEKEKSKIHTITVVEVIKEFLPVIDNFERALEQEDTGDDFRKGVEMIYRQIMNFLEKQGVEVIEAVGKEFNHNYHNAVMQVESDEHKSGIITEELQKGYILEEVVIRPSMVKVAQ